jgi:hypothetical protein
MSGMGIDRSGNGNHWVPNNLATSDQMVDTPTNNFATWAFGEPYNGLATRSEGNLKWKATQNTGWNTMISSHNFPPTGKYYFEHYIEASNGTAGADGSAFGIGKSKDWHTTVGYSSNAPFACAINGGAATSSSYLMRATLGNITGINFTLLTGVIVQLAIDCDTGKCWIGKNNSWLGVSGNTATPGSGNPATGANPVDTVSDITEYASAFMGSNQTGHGLFVSNFGQDATFAGNKSPSTVYDDGKYGSFFYQPPSGFKALCTLNLSDPAVKPGEHFNALTYTGTGSNQSISGVGFQPDLVWMKNRPVGQSHALVDSVRGRSKVIFSNDTSADQTSGSTEDLVSFDSDGFTVGTPARAGSTNNSGSSIISWNWKAGGTAVSNTNGSITSSVSANTASGFSIVSYTANGSSTDTIGHGLSKQLEMVLVKRRTSARNWHIGHKDLPFSSASDSHHGYMAFTTGANNTVNGGRANIPNATTFQGQDSNGETMIAYCFHSVDGFSKIGSYTGNGNADGPFVYTGFQPKYVLFKKTNVANEWMIMDDARDNDNAARNYLKANESDAEGAFDIVDFTSNGFKIRTTDGSWNASGDNYIYMAFAEFPFKFSTAR